MIAAPVLALALAVIVLLASLRLGWRPRLLVLQALAAVALYFSIFPPPSPQRPTPLLVATAGTRATALPARRETQRVFALPEAPPLADAERVPDLATVLRRHPAARVHIVGAGLSSRDAEAARHSLQGFDPSPLPVGLVELVAGERVIAGARWRVHGRVHGVPGAQLALLDPGGRELRRVRIDGSGRFQLDADVRTAGRLAFALHVMDARGRVLERVQLPLDAVPGGQPRVLLYAGAPNAELKYLRRWAVDVDARLRSQMLLGGGLRVGAAPAINASTLAATDLLVLDQRAWRDLGGERQRAVVEAVRGGMGLLLRIGSPLSAGDRASLRVLGLDVAGDAVPLAVTLAPDIATSSQASTVTLSRQALRLQGDAAVALWRDAQGKPLAAWQALGRGRAGVAWLGDSYRLVLAGQGATHARLWADAFATLARADALAMPRVLDAPARVDQRLRICGLPARAVVLEPNGRRVPLLAEGRGHARCAGFWPTQAGWHRLEAGQQRMDWYVRTAGELPGVAAWQARQRTLALLASAPAAEGQTPMTSTPGPRWPWFLAWLAISGLLWWSERRARNVAAG